MLSQKPKPLTPCQKNTNCFPPCAATVPDDKKIFYGCFGCAITNKSVFARTNTPAPFHSGPSWASCVSFWRGFVLGWYKVLHRPLKRRYKRFYGVVFFAGKQKTASFNAGGHFLGCFSSGCRRRFTRIFYFPGSVKRNDKLNIFRCFSSVCR